MAMHPTRRLGRLDDMGGGVWAAPGARVIDRSGARRLAVGREGFVLAMGQDVLVDKTMLIADVLDSGNAATLFCRPRRFGKTLNMTMMKAFLEAPEAGGLPSGEARAAFEGTEVWDAGGGRYRASQGAYPVVYISLNTAKKPTWEAALAEIESVVASEYLRHSYLREAGTPLPPEDVAYFDAVADGSAPESRYAGSLAALCRMLRAYHGRHVVVLIDEYDAPVMAAYTNGYYEQAVSFLKGWLTGALKDGGAALAFACLTGVQRISKESVFSDLNNLYVSTPLNTRFDERFGFTDVEVQALATYLGQQGCMAEAREWYDGYRFGAVDIYNPWSVVSYLAEGCQPGVYWGNTSSNSVVGDLVAGADAETLSDIYTLLEPGGTVDEPLDLGVVFPDIGVRGGALWSMLYLSGYLTTDDTDTPTDSMRLRPLRVPDREVGRLFENEVVRRFRAQAGGARRLGALQGALARGDADAFAEELSRVTERASAFDLTSELPCHMLLMGLLFGTRGYDSPLSNREAGHGRFDIQMRPDPQARPSELPLITVEVKFLKPSDASSQPGALDSRLQELAREAVVQVADKGYDAAPVPGASGRLRWGVAFCGKRVAAACESA